MSQLNCNISLLKLFTDEVLNVERPEKGSDAFLEASRDYDEKMEFLQKIRSRSGVDKTNPRNKTCGYGGSNDPLEDEEQNLNLVRMSGSSFFRKSMNIEKKQEDSVSTNEDTFDENSMNVSVRYLISMNP